jgi:hypothetical protein
MKMHTLYKWFYRMNHLQDVVLALKIKDQIPGT